MFQRWANYELRKLHGALGLGLLLIVFMLSQLVGIVPPKVLADELPNRSLQVYNPLPSAQSGYYFDFDLGTTGTLGSIKFEFCSNSSIFGDACTPPSGFSAAGALLASQSGVTDFSLAPGTPANEIIIARSPSVVPAQTLSYLFNNVINTDTTGTSYVKIYTYASSDASGTPIDEGGIAYPITTALDIAAEVPQYLEFCAGLDIAGFNCAATTGDQLDFGNFSTQAASSGNSQFMAATNADYGYNIILDGNSLTSGNNVISPMTSAGPSRPGTNQFGLNLVANNNPSIGLDPQGPGITAPNSAYSQPDRFYFNSGDVIASAATSDNYRKFTVSYVVNISPSQPAGDYVSTMYFICLANF